MKKKLILLLLISPLSLFCCNRLDGKKDLDILILGNSITYHSPSSELGWTGDWGMAASAADKDFESILKAKLDKTGKYDKVSVTPKNIAVWEKDLKYDLKQFGDIANKKYDIIIVRLGENVSETSPQFSEYESALTSMINYFKDNNTKVIVTGTVWLSAEKDRIQQKVAADNHYDYISLSAFQAEPKNYAYEKFKDEGVSAHPSDFGMNNIAEVLYKKVIAIH